MKTSLESIRSGLVSQRDEIKNNLQKVGLRVTELKQTLRQVNSALKALGEQDHESSSPDQQLVRKIITDLLTANRAGIPRRDLKALVAEKLKQEYQKDEIGLALRMREVLNDKNIATTNDRVVLVEQSQPSLTSASQ